MRSVAFVVALFLAVAPARAADLTLDDVIAMAEAGVSEDVILDTVRKSGVKLTLAPGDVERLRKAGAGDAVVRALGGVPGKKASARDAAEAARTEERAREGAGDLARERERQAEAARELGPSGALEKRTAGELDLLIDRAYERLESGDHAAAAELFDRVVSGGLLAPNTVRFVDASFGLAEALTRAGLPSAAAPHLVDVLRHGPAAPRYAEALTLLAAYASRVDYTHPVLELVDGHDTSKLDAELRDEHAFLTGGYRARFGDHERARQRLAQVRAAGPRGAAAAYRLGLVEVAAGRPLEGLRAFEEAVVRADQHAASGDVRDLAYLALARIAYEVGRWDAAADYYKRIPAGSAMRARARHELVWVLLLSGDDLGALAALAVAQSPRYAELVVPDLAVVEAAIYLDLCRYDDARAQAAAFLTQAGPLLGWLDGVVDLAPAEAYARALEHDAGRGVVQADVDTHAAATAAREVAAEEKRLAELAPRLGDLAARAKQTLGERRRTLEEQAYAAALRRLRAFRLELADLTVNADEVKIEADLAERERLYGGTRRDPPAEPARLRLAEDESTWEIDEEAWLDEEDYVRSLRVSACEPEAGK